MSSRKNIHSDVLDLSLTGSQVGTPVSSARNRPSSAKGSRPGPAAGTRSRQQHATQNGVVAGAGSRRHGRSNSHSGNVSNRSDLSSARTTEAKSSRQNSQRAPQKSPKEEFLALFESSNSQSASKPKITAQQKTKTAWGSTVDSARSTSTVSADGDHGSGGGVSRTSKFSHSVFQPMSARTSSTATLENEADDFDLNDDFDLSLDPPKVLPRPEYSSSGSRSLIKANGARTKCGTTFSKSPMFEFEQVVDPVVPQTLPLPQRTVPTPFDDVEPRSSIYGDNELFVNSDSASIQKATKLNSIANNMTSQALSPGTKTPFLGMENSYQNIKHKTPVNQVKESGQCTAPPMGRNLAEEQSRQRAVAATKIQNWFKRHQRRRKAGHAAVKRLLDNKRQEKCEERNRELEMDRREDDRKRIREEKARKARQEAISELQRKREEKRLENQRMAEEDIAFLQASGKVSRSAAHKSNVKKKPERRQQQTGPRNPKDSLGNVATGGGATSRKVEDLFQNKTRSSVRHNDISPRNELEQPDCDYASGGHDPGAVGPGASGGEAPQSPSQAATKTTIDDLMATLQKLEEDEKFPTSRNEKNEKPRDWLDELEDSTTTQDREAFLSAERLQKLNPSKDNLKKSGFLSDEKLRSIMCYLDEVETADRISEIDQEIHKMNDALEKPALLVPSGEEIAQMEQASAMAAEVTSTMLTQKLDLEEKKRTVQMLQKALNQQRELTVRHAKETEKEMKKRLDVQKDEYEETIKRHLSFIDQLIDDKKTLSEKCEHMVKELKVVDRKYSDRIKTLQENHAVELKKVQEVHTAAEKLRREKWIDEKTKKIKEMTVKGLEPEIQRLIAKHKAEVKKLKSIHEAELLASDERAGQRYIKMTEELRDQLAHEKEAACSRERELARQTYEKTMQQEEESYQQQRRRLYGEIQEEKERLNQQASRQRAELDKLQRQLEDSHSNSAEAMRKEYEKAREEQERRHQAEIRQLKEQLAVEKAAWEENYLKKNDTWLVHKERELKEQVRRERDKEIELVIERLEEDNQAARDECERVAENRVKRIRDKYEAELSELEKSERVTTEKYNKVKAQLAEVEGENERKKVVVKQKDREVSELKKLLDKLNEERDHVSDVIRQEFADKLVATDEENRRIKNEMSELKARHRIELERAKTEMEVVQKSKDEEMEQVHERVKVAIVKKEEVVNQLREQYQAALKRADHLEGLLEQQRKQLLGRKN